MLGSIREEEREMHMEKTRSLQKVMGWHHLEPCVHQGAQRFRQASPSRSGKSSSLSEKGCWRLGVGGVYHPHFRDLGY